jgi:hypothetical protein
MTMGLSLMGAMVSSVIQPTHYTAQSFCSTRIAPTRRTIFLRG